MLYNNYMRPKNLIKCSIFKNTFYILKMVFIFGSKSKHNLDIIMVLCFLEVNLFFFETEKNATNTVICIFSCMLSHRFIVFF